MGCTKSKLMKLTEINKVNSQMNLLTFPPGKTLLLKRIEK